MYSLSDPAVISQRDSLESRARALQKDLCDIRSRQNQLLPVAALCQEVLLQIFEYAAEISVKRDGTLARLRLAHVCQHWRETALTASSFWAIIRHGVHLIAGRKGLVECFLERSRSAPLQVILSRIASGNSPVVEKVLNIQSRRVHSLCLCDLHIRLVRGIWEVLEEHPPPLAHLKLSGPLLPSGASSQRLRKLSSLFPSLRTLEVVGPRPDTPLVRSLRFKDWALPHTLSTLDVASLGPFSYSSWTEVLEQIRPLCDLRVLKLHNIVGQPGNSPADTGDNYPSERSLTFPHLHTLLLEGHSEEHVPLLQSLVLPALTQAKIDIAVQGLNDHTINVLCNIVLPTLRPTFLSTWGSQVVTFEQGGVVFGGTSIFSNLHYTWSTGTLSKGDYVEPDFPMMRPTPHLSHSSLRVDINFSRDQLSPAASDMQKSLDEIYAQGIPGLDNIKVFILNGPKSPHYGLMLPQTIRSMLGLRVLCFRYLTPPLDEIDSLFTQVSDGTHPFPNLHTLQFGRIVVEPKLLEDLATILQARKFTDTVRRLRLVFIKCTFTGIEMSIAAIRQQFDPLADVEFYRADGRLASDEDEDMYASTSDSSSDSDDDGNEPIPKWQDIYASSTGNSENDEDDD